MPVYMCAISRRVVPQKLQPDCFEIQDSLNRSWFCQEVTAEAVFSEVQEFLETSACEMSRPETMVFASSADETLIFVYTPLANGPENQTLDRLRVVLGNHKPNES